MATAWSRVRRKPRFDWSTACYVTSVKRWWSDWSKRTRMSVPTIHTLRSSLFFTLSLSFYFSFSFFFIFFIFLFPLPFRRPPVPDRFSDVDYAHPQSKTFILPPLRSRVKCDKTLRSISMDHPFSRGLSNRTNSYIKNLLHGNLCGKKWIIKEEVKNREKSRNHRR